MHTTVSFTDVRQSPDLEQKIQAADDSLRKSFAGLDVDGIIPEVQRSLTELGIDLAEADVREYAQHIADRADHVLVV